MDDEQTWPERIATAQYWVRAAEEQLEREVCRARAAGVTWSEVGAALGITKQAAQQRFGWVVESIGDLVAGQ